MMDNNISAIAKPNLVVFLMKETFDKGVTEINMEFPAILQSDNSYV